MALTPPRTLKGQQRRLWASLAAVLAVDGELSVAKRRALTEHVCATFEAEDLRRRANAEPLVEGSMGQQRANPLFELADAADARAARLGDDLGLTERARRRAERERERDTAARKAQHHGEWEASLGDPWLYLDPFDPRTGLDWETYRRSDEHDGPDGADAWHDARRSTRFQAWLKARGLPAYDEMPGYEWPEFVAPASWGKIREGHVWPKSWSEPRGHRQFTEDELAELRAGDWGDGAEADAARRALEPLPAGSVA